MSSNTSLQHNKKAGLRRGQDKRRMEFPNDPESFNINGNSPPSKHISSSPPLLSSANHSKDSSPDDCLTIAPSDPLKLLPSHFRKTLPKAVRQDMQPPSSSGMNTPEKRSPALGATLSGVGISQEVGTSSQLDLGAPRPGGRHNRTSSIGTNTPTGSTSGLRRNASSTIITNVDKHGGPRRRRSKNGMRSRSRSQSRPDSPTGSVCSDVSSVSGKSLTIVLKLGTSSICDPVTHMPMLANLSLMVETIIKLKELGHRVVLVSSGAVGVGLRRLHMAEKPKELASIQVSLTAKTTFVD